MIQAQRIAKSAGGHSRRDLVLVTEKIAALSLYKKSYGAEDKSFDPIVVSGPNGDLPTVFQ